MGHYTENQCDVEKVADQIRTKGYAMVPDTTRLARMVDIGMSKIEMIKWMEMRVVQIDKQWKESSDEITMGRWCELNHLLKLAKGEL